MAKRDAELEALRAQLIKRQRAAANKISKNRRLRGVEIAGTQFDPRVSRETISRLTKASLKKRLNTVESFVSRSTQFVGGHMGAPLPRADYNQARELVDRAKAKRQKWEDSISAITLPDSSETIGQRRAKMRGPHSRAGGNANAPEVLPINFDEMRFYGAAGLKKFKQNIAKLTETGHKPGSVKAWRNQFEQMLDGINSERGESMRRAARGLSDKKFAILWNDTPFSTAVSIEYETAGHGSKPGSKEGEVSAIKSQILEQSIKEADRLVSWAKTLKLGG